MKLRNKITETAHFESHTLACFRQINGTKNGGVFNMDVGLVSSMS
jgi:hypothetical protein